MFRYEIGESPLATLAEILVPRKRIACVSTWDEQHESPVKRLHNFQTKVQSNVVVIVENYLIEGLAHLPSTANHVPFTLHREGGRFFPVTQASISSGHSKRLTLPYLLVNNELASVFGFPSARDNLDEKKSQELPPIPSLERI